MLLTSVISAKFIPALVLWRKRLPQKITSINSPVTGVMSKTSMRCIVFIALILSPCIYADELFLHVKAKYLEHMGVPPKDDCNLQLKNTTPKEKVESGLEVVDVCWQFYSWHTYKAKIKEVIFGEVKSKTIYFAAYSHTEFNKQYLRDFFVRLEPLDEERKKFLGVEYQVVDHEAPKKTICLKNKLPKKYERVYLAQDGEYHCYYSDDLAENS